MPPNPKCIGCATTLLDITTLAQERPAYWCPRCRREADAAQKCLDAELCFRLPPAPKPMAHPVPSRAVPAPMTTMRSFKRGAVVGFCIPLVCVVLSVLVGWPLP